MTMQDRDFYALAAVMGALGIISIMHSRLIGQIYKDHMKVAADVAYLMDYKVVDSRETEDR